MSGRSFQRYIHLSSYLIVLFSFFYIFFVGYRHWDELISVVPSIKGWSVLGLSAITYSILCFILPYVWYKIVYILGGDINYKECLTVYGRSQIAKYIPGNVFHFMGRHLLGREIGLSNSILALSMFLETFMLLIVASTLAVIAAVLFGWQQKLLSGTSHRVEFFYSLLFVLLAGLILYFIWKRKKKTSLDEINLRSLLYLSLISFIVYTFFFVVSGLILSFLIINFYHIEYVHHYIFIGAYVVSWIAGFITPGAPGGIGVREVVLVSILSPSLQEAQAFIIAIAFRFVTIIGDFIFFLATYGLSILRRNKLSSN